MAADSQNRKEAVQMVEALLSARDTHSEIQEELRRGFSKIEAVLAKAQPNQDSDGWLDSKAAAKYMGNVSRTTFDKYRYETSPRLTGCALDGKVLYKKSDIDAFVRLYALKSAGLA